jgi:serine/threonine protein kinase
VLDFGLARALGGDAASVDFSESSTRSLAATEQGVLLGTPAYMAPEQARGESVDKRADIRAFGCVLFEMLSGRKAFGGATQSDILAEVLKSEPDWERYRASYRPERQATEAEARRVIDFARLVHQATDEEFRARIDSFLDVAAFLRFLAANALTSNLESFFALGHNYWLYLDPGAGKLHFIPGDLEFSLANFLLMGLCW